MFELRGRSSWMLSCNLPRTIKCARRALLKRYLWQPIVKISLAQHHTRQRSRLLDKATYSRFCARDATFHAAPAELNGSYEASISFLKCKKPVPAKASRRREPRHGVRWPAGLWFCYVRRSPAVRTGPSVDATRSQWRVGAPIGPLPHCHRFCISGNQTEHARLLFGGDRAGLSLRIVVAGYVLGREVGE